MKPTQSLPLRIRAATSQDVPFIFNSWLRSYRETGLICRNVSNTFYFENHHKILQKIISRSTLIIASNTENPDDIYGYIVAERVDGIFTLHYIYVKQPFRRLGIAKELLNHFEHNAAHASCYTHHTKVAERLAAKYNMLYHPYIVLVDYEAKKEEKSEE